MTQSDIADTVNIAITAICNQALGTQPWAHAGALSAEEAARRIARARQLGARVADLRADAEELDALAVAGLLNAERRPSPAEAFLEAFVSRRDVVIQLQAEYAHVKDGTDAGAWYAAGVTLEDIRRACLYHGEQGKAPEGWPCGGCPISKCRK